MDCSLPGSSIHGIFQARILEWVAISFSKQEGKKSEVSQSCLTLLHPPDCGLPGSSIHEIFQARTLECVAITFCRQGLKSQTMSCVSLGNIFNWAIVFLLVKWEWYCFKEFLWWLKMNMSSTTCEWSLCHVQLFATPWTVGCWVPPSMGFSKQEYWNGLPFPSPEDLPNSGIEPGSPALQADSLLAEPPGKSI